MGIRIPDEEFKHIAMEIPEGQRRKVEHCGADASMIVSHESAQYRAHCFRCHGDGFIRKERNVAQILASLRAKQEADAQAVRSIELPEGCVTTDQWPKWARLWLAKAGLGSSDVDRLGFLYSPNMDRVVLPVYDRQGRIRFWQARGNGTQPKYLSPKDVDRKQLIPAYGPETGVVLLTEDILSAAKVGQVNEAWSLMGTVMHTAVLLEAHRRKLHVIVALDPDKAGIAGAAATMKSLGAYSIPAYNVTSRLPSDPKLMSRDSIRCLIQEVIHECNWAVGSDAAQVLETPGQV